LVTRDVRLLVGALVKALSVDEEMVAASALGPLPIGELFHGLGVFEPAPLFTLPEPELIADGGVVDSLAQIARLFCWFVRGDIVPCVLPARGVAPAALPGVARLNQLEEAR
jgi:hypothetical protein